MARPEDSTLPTHALEEQDESVQRFVAPFLGTEVAADLFETPGQRGGRREFLSALSDEGDAACGRSTMSGNVGRHANNNAADARLDQPTRASQNTAGRFVTYANLHSGTAQSGLGGGRHRVFDPEGGSGSRAPDRARWSDDDDEEDDVGSRAAAGSRRPQRFLATSSNERDSDEDDGESGFSTFRSKRPIDANGLAARHRAVDAYDDQRQGQRVFNQLASQKYYADNGLTDPRQKRLQKQMRSVGGRRAASSDEGQSSSDDDVEPSVAAFNVAREKSDQQRRDRTDNGSTLLDS